MHSLTKIDSHLEDSIKDCLVIVLCTLNLDVIVNSKGHGCLQSPHTSKKVSAIVTWSDKKGLITHLKVLRYDDFKFLKCCISPMKAAMYIRFSH